MKHSVVYVASATKFSDSLIHEHGVLLFVELVLLNPLVIFWIFARRRQGPVDAIPETILVFAKCGKTSARFWIDTVRGAYRRVTINHRATMAGFDSPGSSECPQP
jgi:hypothetical protein